MIFSLIIIADQVSKFFIKANFSTNPYHVKKIIDNVFYLRYVKNRGAVWGLFSNSPTLVPKIITGLSLVAVVVVIYYFLKVTSECALELTSLSFIIGGAIGNITDRLIQGFVVDFLDVIIINYHWPTFNIADSFITLGVIFLIFSIWRGKCTQF